MTTYATESRIDGFRTAAAHALEEATDGHDAVERITSVYSGDLNALDARLEGANEAASHALADARMRYAMLSSVTTTLSAEVIRAAELSAHLDLVRDIVTGVRSLVDAMEAQEEPGVSLDDLKSVLARPLPPRNDALVVGAFWPDHRYVEGHFATPDGMHRTLPFMGWGAVAGRLASDQTVQPMFLLDTQTVPAYTLLQAYNLELKSLN